APNAHSKAGRLGPLGLTTDKRSSLLPDVPTLSEAGLPGFEMLSWFGLLAPAGTPGAIVARLNAETIKALNAADMKPVIAGMGSELRTGSPEQFADYIKSEIARIGKIAKATCIRAE